MLRVAPEMNARIPGWLVVAVGVLALGALSIVVLFTYAVRVKWGTGSLEILPAASAGDLPRTPPPRPNLGERPVTPGLKAN